MDEARAFQFMPQILQAATVNPDSRFASTCLRLLRGRREEAMNPEFWRCLEKRWRKLANVDGRPVLLLPPLSHRFADRGVSHKDGPLRHLKLVTEVDPRRRRILRDLLKREQAKLRAVMKRTCRKQEFAIVQTIERFRCKLASESHPLAREVLLKLLEEEHAKLRAITARTNRGDKPPSA